MSVKHKLDVYPLENYVLNVQTKEDVEGGGTRNNNSNNNAASDRRVLRTPMEKIRTLKARCNQYDQCVQSVEGVLMVHLHRHPHVLLLKQSIRPRTGRSSPLTARGAAEVVYRLPGGRCRRGEAEEACLLRKLGRHLLNEPKASMEEDRVNAGGPADQTILDVGRGNHATEATTHFRVGECLSKWFRPYFSPLMYPYIPPHLTASTVREMRTIFLVHVDRQAYFNIPQSDEVELVAVPLFDLYDHANKYGPILASLPAVLSGVIINLCSTGEY